MASSFLRFLDYTQRRTTVGRTPLDEWSARRKDLYPTTHNTHNRQTSMPLVRFETTISAGERPQTYALDRAATGTGLWYRIVWQIFWRDLRSLTLHMWRRNFFLKTCRLIYRIPQKGKFYPITCYEDTDGVTDTIQHIPDDIYLYVYRLEILTL
jgi:hypothetical protein